MKPTADVELVVTQQRAMNAINAFERRFDRMTKRMDKSLKNQNKTTKKTRGLFADIGRNIKANVVGTGSWLASMGSLYTVAQLVRSEYEAINAAQRKSLDDSIRFSDGIEDIRSNLSVVSSELSDITLEEIQQKILDANLVDRAGFTGVVAGAISSDPTRPVSERVQTAIELAELRPDLQSNTEALKSLTEMVVGQQRQFGGSTIAQLGMTEIAKQVSQISDIAKFADNLGPAAEKLKAYGFSQQEGLALVAAFSSAIVDKTGETTQTNVVKVMHQLMMEIRKLGLDIRGMDMIDFIQSNDPKARQLRTSLLGGMQEGLSKQELMSAIDAGGGGNLVGRSAGKTALYNLFQAIGVGEEQGTMKDLLKKARAEIPQSHDEATRQRLLKQEAQLANPAFQLAQAKRLYQSQQDRLAINPSEGFRGLMVDVSKQISKQAQGYAITGQMDAFVNQLESRQKTPVQALQKVIDSVRSQKNRIADDLQRGAEFNAFGSMRRRGMQGPAGFWGMLYDSATGGGEPLSNERRTELRGIRSVLERSDQQYTQMLEALKNPPTRSLTQPKPPGGAKAQAVGG